MVNEIDGYKAPTESQSSRPLPACWMVKEIARYVAGKCSLASNLIHHRASSMGFGDPRPLRPNVHEIAMNQNSRQWQLFISLDCSL